MSNVNLNETAPTQFQDIGDVSLAYRIGRELANSRAWPQWRAGSEFRAVRERSAARRQ